MADAYYDPTFEHAVRVEIREKRGCGVCLRSTEVVRGAYICTENKTYPACRRQKKGFLYDQGED